MTVTAKIETMQPPVDAVRKDIDDLQEEILEIGGIRLRGQRSLVDGIREQLQLHSDKIKKFKVEKSSREKSLKKIVLSIEKKEAELAGVDEEISALAESANCQSDAAENMKQRVSEAEFVSSR